MGLRSYFGRKKRWEKLTTEIKRRGINCYQKESSCNQDLLNQKINERYHMCYKNPNIPPESPLGNTCKKMDIEIEQIEKLHQDGTCNLCDEYLRTKRMPSKKERRSLEKSGYGQTQRDFEEAQRAEAMLPSVPRNEPSDSSQSSQQQVTEP